MICMVSDEDYVTGSTGKTLSVTVSKNGGAFAAADNSVTEVGSGWYKITLSTDETDTAGDLVIRSTATGCAEWRQIREVVSTPAGSFAATLSITERNAIADHVIMRNLPNAEDATGPDTASLNSIFGHARMRVGKVSSSGNVITIYMTDDSTALDTVTVSTSASAELATGQTV